MTIASRRSIDPPMKNLVCPLCRAGGPRRAIAAPRSRQGSDVLRCESCGVLFLAEFPGAEARRQQYQDDYYEAGSGQRFVGIFEPLVRAFREARARDIVSRLPPRRDNVDAEDAGVGAGTDAVLDVGCGRGVLLERFHRRGWRAVGTQLSETAARACEASSAARVHVGELPDLRLPQASFRVVALYHVLEHLDRPLDYLTEARRLLRSDGLLVVEVPDAGAPGFRLLGARDLCYDYPHHLFFFTRRTLEGLLARAGFTVCGARRFSLEYSPFTTLSNWLNALPGEPCRLYRSLMRNAAARRLRRRPLTWCHWALGAVLALPALLVSLTGLVLPAGNTLRLYCRPSGDGGRAGDGAADCEMVHEMPRAHAPAASPRNAGAAAKRPRAARPRKAPEPA